MKADDDERGGPVKKLDPDDMLNRALVAIQLAFNDIYATCQEFIDVPLRKARTRGGSGVLDIKLTMEPDRIILRRRVRKLGEPAPRGQWWGLTFTPEILSEFFERIKPGPEPEEPKPLDVDASSAAAAPDDGPVFDPAEVMRARQRELVAFDRNVKRTKDELAAAGRDVYFADIDEHLAELAAAFDAATKELEAKGVLQ